MVLVGRLAQSCAVAVDLSWRPGSKIRTGGNRGAGNLSAYSKTALCTSAHVTLITCEHVQGLFTGPRVLISDTGTCAG